MSEPKPTWTIDAADACPFCHHSAHTGFCNQCHCWLPEPAYENVPPSAATNPPPATKGEVFPWMKPQAPS